MGGRGVWIPRKRLPRWQAEGRGGLPGWVLAGRWTAPLLLISVVGVAYLLTLRTGHTWSGDFALYISHARNIAEGRGYADTGYIYNPHFPSLSPRAYPPVFPLLLSPIYTWFGLDLQPMKVEVILFFLLSLAAVYAAFANLLGRRARLLLVALIGFNPWFWAFKDEVVSDIPFLSFTYLAISFFAKLEDSRSPGAVARAVAVVAFGYLAYGTRSVGVVLIVAFVLHDVVAWRRPRAVTLVVAGAVAALAGMQMTFVRGETSYFDQIRLDSALPGILFANASHYVGALREMLLGGSSPLHTVPFLVISLFAVLGFILRLRARTGILEVYFFLYAGAILFWPSLQGPRFLVPVVPIYLYYALTGAARAWDPGRAQGALRLGARTAVVSTLLALLAAWTSAYGKADLGALPDGVATPSSLGFFRYVAESTPADAVFVFRKPSVLALYTGRSASVYHHTADDSQLLGYFAQIGATHVAVRATCGFPGWCDQDFLVPFLSRQGQYFAREWSNAEFTVYRFHANPARGEVTPEPERPGDPALSYAAT